MGGRVRICSACLSRIEGLKTERDDTKKDEGLQTEDTCTYCFGHWRLERMGIDKPGIGKHSLLLLHQAGDDTTVATVRRRALEIGMKQGLHLDSNVYRIVLRCGRHDHWCLMLRRYVMNTEKDKK